MDAEGSVVLPGRGREGAGGVHGLAGCRPASSTRSSAGCSCRSSCTQPASTWFQAACVGAFAYPFLAEGNANLLVAHGTPEQVRHLRRPVIEGRWYGTMALSEPQAGSSLGDITTRAVPPGRRQLPADRHQDVDLRRRPRARRQHRAPGARPHPGRARRAPRASRCSWCPSFLVTDDGSLGERNDVVLVGLNHKMGYRGTTNTLLNFGEGALHPGWPGGRRRPPRRRGGPRASTRCST